MKLYLSSYRVPVPEALFALLSKPPSDCKVAIIPNAKDYKLPEERAFKLDELIVYLAGWGMVSNVIDLREYEDSNVLRMALGGHDVVWVAGGNIFIVRAEMRRSGFEQILPELLSGGMVYCGESAGAIAAGTNLEGSETADDPDLAAEVIWEGLGLVDKIVVPHADSPDFFAYAQSMKQRYKNDVRVVYLNDTQALVVNGADQKL